MLESTIKKVAYEVTTEIFKALAKAKGKGNKG